MEWMKTAFSLISRELRFGLSLQFVFLEFFGILGHGEMVDHVLDVATEESLQVVDGVANTMVGDTALWKVVSADLGTAVAGRHQGTAAAGDVVNVFLMLVVIYIGIQTAQSTLLVLRLVTGFGTFDKDFLHLTGLRVLSRFGADG